MDAGCVLSSVAPALADFDLLEIADPRGRARFIGSSDPAGIGTGNGRCEVRLHGAGDVGAVLDPLNRKRARLSIEELFEQVGRPLPGPASEFHAHFGSTGSAWRTG